MVVHFDDSNFQAEVMKSEMPVVVDFFAEWCGPCKMLAPILEKLSTEFDGKVKVGKLDVDNEPVTSEQFGIQSLPTIMFFKGGQPIGQILGFKSEADLRKEFEKLIA